MIRSVLAAAAALVLASSAPAAAQPPKGPPVWVVKDADSEMVLFGSVHVLPPGMAWKPPALAAALRHADDLWFELPPGPAAEQESARLAGERGVLPPGQSLFTRLPPADSARLVRVAEAYGVDKAMLDRLEPWLAELALAGAAFRRSGAGLENGVEKAVEAAAPATARRRAFETPGEQLAIFDEAPEVEQIASLRETLREMEEDPQAFDKLVAAWAAGDIATIDREALQPLRRASPLLFRRLVDDRNARWVRTLDTRLKGQGRTVVVVGMGHLIGEGGVPARLRALGYSVTGP
ncbi:TraB/GumN family protein [Phenylobacterium sp. J426]|uniref:TraB/GumN family protein n=1 Tax=Phenylobacterium sp. J426 TaxID=2898439 RepID=UPI002150DB83|nr:TraB/GumN family protein [Phenylobacterium sp. J426]MCR5874019.1 TraB/GumN family protein [Phenylobacterium sp. J426]